MRTDVQGVQGVQGGCADARDSHGPVEDQPAGVNVAESRYSCMVWYDAAVGDYVAVSPEWGGSAVGIGQSRSAAVQALEALISRLESAHDADAEPVPYPPTTLAAAAERERERLIRGSAEQAATPRASAGRRPPLLTPT